MRSLRELRMSASVALGLCMIVPVRLVAALGVAALAGAAVSAFLLGAPLLGQPGYGGSGGRNDVRVDPLCGNAPSTSEAAFHSEMSGVNARMHAGMTIAPSGNTDRDFARIMIAHHQGAIDMALVQLKHSNDKRLRRLAQSIIVEQGQEIAYMRSLLEEDNQTSPTDQVAGQ